jgi:hypothetical protein
LRELGRSGARLESDPKLGPDVEEFVGSLLEASANFYQTTRCYNPEDSHLHTNRRENLKSYFVNVINPGKV